MGAIFLNVNRNKRSVVLDLKKPAARDACLALAKKADVLVYNIRPQAMARLKLSYEDVRTVNPRIIYVGCFGYSQRGPYAAKAAYDDMIQGASGLPWLLQKQGAAEPRYAPMIVADRSVGQQVASAVSAALYHREKTGKGQRVDVPMWEHLLQIVLGDHLGGYTFDPQQGEPGYARILTPDRRPYQTKDGYVCALIYNDKQWKAFFDIIGKPEMLARARVRDAGGAQPELRGRLRHGRRGDEDAQHRVLARGAGARRHPGAAHEQPRRHRRTTRTSNAIGYLADRRAPERRPHPHARRALRVVRIEARVPAPRAAPGRAHARGAARGRALRSENRFASRKRSGARRGLTPYFTAASKTKSVDLSSSGMK